MSAMRPLKALPCATCGRIVAVETNVVAARCAECASRFDNFRATCRCRLVPEVERRPGNALNIEIGQPQPRCIEKKPEHWPESMSGLRWLASGGNWSVFGLCSFDCPRIKCSAAT